ncbi:inactive ADP-ribosyltransferase ARH2 isoform X2 [Tamandua tetradactyla]
MSRMLFDRAICAILGSLLLYITDQADGPQGPRQATWAQGKENKVNHKPEPQEPSRRPTKFQLLQSKFMNTNREPYIKKTREVGRLIFKDKQGPSRSFVNATINKLLEKTKDKASSPGEEKKFSTEKPRWGHSNGKSTVKNILKIFLAAEEKEAKEKEARETPPAGQPKTASGILPKIISKKNSVLSKLKEKFEQTSSLCSEANVLLLRKEERKKKNLQRKKMYRPEIRVLHTATMVSTCLKTPVAWYLACTDEPTPAFSIATVVCSPRSWLSHCAKISHSNFRSVPRRETSSSSNMGEFEPHGNKITEKGPLDRVPHGQMEPTQALKPKVMAGLEDLAPLKRAFPSATLDCLPQLNTYSAFCKSKALPDHTPGLSPLHSVNQRSTGLDGCDKTMELQRGGGAAQGLGEAGLCIEFPHSGEAFAVPSPRLPVEGVGEIPDITMTVCSSEDETERAMADSERDPLFAIQKYFPEQKVLGHIPPLNTPAVQAARRAQCSMEAPQITVQLPVVYEMPPTPVTLQNASGSEDKYINIFGGENVTENAETLFPIMTENKRDNQATVKPSKPSKIPAKLSSSSKQVSQADPKLTPLREAASFDRNIPKIVLTSKPQNNSTGEKEDKYSFEKSNNFKIHDDTYELNDDKHQLPEYNEIPITDNGTTSNYSTTSKNSLGGNTCLNSDSQQLPSSNKRNLMGISALLAGPSKDCLMSESFTPMSKNILCEQEDCKRSPLTGFGQSLKIAEGSTNHDFGKNKHSSLNELPKPSIKAFKEMASVGSVNSHTMPSLDNTLNPKSNMAEEANTLDKEEYRTSSSHFSTKENSLVGEDLPYEPSKHHLLAQSGSSKHGKSQSAERNIFSDTKPCQSSPSGYQIFHSNEASAANSQLMFDKSQLCVSNELAESKNNTAVESRNSMTREGKPLGNNLKSQILTSNYSRPSMENSAAESPCHSFGKQQLPSLSQQAKDKKYIVSGKQLSFDKDSFHPFSMLPSTEEVTCVNRASREQKNPNLQTQLLSSGTVLSKHKADVPEEKNLINKVKESQLALASLGSQKNHDEQEKNISSNVRLHQTQQQDDSGKKKMASYSEKSMLYTAKKPQTQASNNLAGNEKMPAEMKNSFQHVEKGEGHLSGELGGNVTNPTQRSDAQAEKNKSTLLGEPGKPGNLVAQGQQKGKEKAKENKMVSHDVEQPKSSIVEVKLIAEKSGLYQKTAPSDGWKMEQGTHHTPVENQPNTSKNKTPSHQKLKKSYLEKRSAIPMPDSGGCQTPVPVQGQLPNTPKREKDIWDQIDNVEDKKHRKLAKLAKYKAQSFSDQESFDLSFRPTTIRANDTFEFPK